MPAIAPEQDFDRELLVITGGQEISNIPNSEVEKLNSVLEFLLRKWGKELEAGMGKGMKRKGPVQEKLTAFVLSKVNESGSALGLKIAIMDSKGFEDHKDVKKNEDGLPEISVRRVNKFMSDDKVFPYMILPETKPSVDIVLEADKIITVEPDDIYSLNFFVVNI